MQGKTVEVGRAHFETETTRFTILDAPVSICIAWFPTNQFSVLWTWIFSRVIVFCFELLGGLSNRYPSLDSIVYFMNAQPFYAYFEVTMWYCAVVKRKVLSLSCHTYAHPFYAYMQLQWYFLVADVPLGMMKLSQRWFHF